MNRVVVFVLLLAACSPVVEPIAPERIEPGLAQMRAVELMAECTGVELDARAIRWYAVEGFSPENVNALAKWVYPDEIFLDRDRLSNVWLSAHEVVHYAIGEDDTEHRHRWWAECLPESWR